MVIPDLPKTINKRLYGEIILRVPQQSNGVACECCENAWIWANDLPAGLNPYLMAPALPNAGNAVAVLQYQSLLASATAGGATRALQGWTRGVAAEVRVRE